VRHRLSLVVGLLCLFAAIPLALLAEDVRGLPTAMRTGDVQLRVRPAWQDPWPDSGRLPGRAAERLLNVDDDLEYRRALRFYVMTRGRFRARIPGFVPPLDGARRRLRRVVKESEDPQQRALASNLLGVLTYQTGGFIDENYIRRTLNFFRDAVRLDPANEQAKFNLELLLYRSRLISDTSQGSLGTGRATIDVEGAGSSDPGRGY
jgi:hypothetical protein